MENEKKMRAGEKTTGHHSGKKCVSRDNAPNERSHKPQKPTTMRNGTDWTCAPTLLPPATSPVAGGAGIHRKNTDEKSVKNIQREATPTNNRFEAFFFYSSI